jgi:hypothetical protein
VPAEVRPVLPWIRRHVERVARRYDASLTDLWDEAVTALIRAAVYFKPQDPAAYRSTQYAQPLPAAKSFRYYAQLAVHRACWRYVIRGQATQVRTIPLEQDTALPEHHRAHAGLPAALFAPSAEDEAIARDAARRACILREHAELAAARGDDDTTSRLRAAASAADRVARRPRHHSSPSSRSASVGSTTTSPPLDRVDRALRAHADGAAPNQLAEELDLAEKTVRNHLTTLRAQGRAEPFGDSR